MPYPKISFMLNSMAPIVHKYEPFTERDDLSLTNLTLQCFDQENLMAMVDPSQGRYMACCLIYRGEVAQTELKQILPLVKSKKTI